ncbi:hypothetical protein AVEN_24306-1 [Araneus ventricosus]|uniref:Retrovirus-related Pol polyprotein from transposon TNT 1-94-like beta-barrel domain-containing protein n=1 Tax=Araneus ventricosus TaxID=182803 RepID=A0A4Y2PEN4_ARAVE|nr:hypothetical protein AVEN_24306-1 [Araneus ventricosus]
MEHPCVLCLSAGFTEKGVGPLLASWLRLPKKWNLYWCRIGLVYLLHHKPGSSLLSLTSKFCRLKASECFSCGKAEHYKRDYPVSKTAADSGAKHSVYVITFAAGTVKEDKFIIEYGATSHLCSRKQWFSSLEPASGIIKYASKSAVIEIEGIGIIRGEISNNDHLNLKDVLYVPNLNGQFVSVKKIEAAGFYVIFKIEEAFFLKKKTSVYYSFTEIIMEYI